MNKDNSEEIFPIVDETGAVIGKATRGECHSGSKLLHPVVHLHVFDPEGRLYLQRRPDWKDIQPGKWDTAVGGHVDYGEAVADALAREAREELGIESFEPEAMLSYVFESDRERELVNVFRTVTDRQPRPTDELDGGRFWTRSEIIDAIGSGILTPNFEQEYLRLFPQENSDPSGHTACLKLLHTSDWHLGHILYNHERTEEHAHMLRRMCEIVAEERPDLFLLSGDIYHTGQPSAGVQRAFADALTDIHEANPGMKIVVIAGNHDSGTRHEIFSRPLRSLNIETIGLLTKDSQESMIIEIDGKGYVVAVPYCHERMMPEGLFRTLAEEVRRRNKEGLPVVLAAHLTVAGSDFRGHDDVSDKSVGGIDSITLEEIGDGYDYIALGHIHHAQWLPGSRRRARYSGSPMAVSFDEDYTHSVTIVSLGKEGTIESRTIEIDNPRPLVTLPKSGTATWEEGKKLLEEFPADKPACIRLRLEVDGFMPPFAREEAMAISEDKAWDFCTFNITRRHAEKSREEEITVEEFREKDPYEIALSYMEEKGISFTDDERTLLRDIIKDAGKTE